MWFRIVLWRSFIWEKHISQTIKTKQKWTRNSWVSAKSKRQNFVNHCICLSSVWYNHFRERNRSGLKNHVCTLRHFEKLEVKHESILICIMAGTDALCLIFQAGMRAYNHHSNRTYWGHAWPKGGRAYMHKWDVCASLGLSGAKALDIQWTLLSSTVAYTRRSAFSAANSLLSHSSRCV